MKISFALFLALNSLIESAMACEESVLYAKVAWQLKNTVKASEMGSDSKFSHKANILVIKTLDEKSNERYEFIGTVRSTNNHDAVLISGKFDANTCEIEPRVLAGGSRVVKIRD